MPIISAFAGVEFGNRQEKEWSHNFVGSQLFASVSATARDLVMVGGTNDRKFHIFDAKDGKLSWEQKLNSGITAMPIAYEIDGTEYIAVQAGWGVDAQRIQDALPKDPKTDVIDNVPQGGVVGFRGEKVSLLRGPAALRRVAGPRLPLGDRFA